MLTTQQFQRAASLIASLEFIRRSGRLGSDLARLGGRFSLGLWIGGAGSPNTIRDAKDELGKFRRGELDGNPLVLTECPWCRSEIGRYSKRNIPKQYSRTNAIRIAGIQDNGAEGPMLHCPGPGCDFGKVDPDYWLPIEVIDERIYKRPPSLIIATADKLAMIAFKPEAGALFGITHWAGQPTRTYTPPALIIQDELHLISGPLGTMYGLYEGIIECFCTSRSVRSEHKPKIIASTATIRGAGDQVMSVYCRPEVMLFPSPGLLMGDSFFGRYAREENGSLRSGRLYVGIHASDYGSVLTTQVRTFSAALSRPCSFESDEKKDPWWTLLVFYNEA
jgi:hypothetical protein